MTRHEVELLLDAHAVLGEGPHWDAAAERLIWVDIEGCAVHLTDRRGGDRALAIGSRVGAAVPRVGGGLLLALADGFAFLDTTTGAVEPAVAVEDDRPGNRMNDGACDPAGRFLAGTMAIDESQHDQGTLYRLDPDLSVTPLLAPVTISNGIGFSLDGGTMYYVDTPTQRVDAFDYDVATGVPTRRRALAEFPPADGAPDGLTVDAEGCLWVAFWGGGCLRRLAPDGGVLATVEVPVANVTSCAFGGPSLDELYITTAFPEAGEPEPHAGGVFVARPGVRGLPGVAFAG